MTLWIQPLFGDPFNLPFSPPDPSTPEGWRRIYDSIYDIIPNVKEEEKALHQLRLIHGDSMDLSDVKEGDILRLVVTERMVERWVSESLLSSMNSYQVWHSTMSWFNRKWGDPYETPSVYYRTPLLLHVVLREQATGVRAYQAHSESFGELGGAGPAKKQEWYPTLRKALLAVQTEQRCGEEMTDKTLEHLLHLWGLYHGTHQHLVEQGRLYE